MTIETIVGDRLADNAHRVGHVFVEGLADLAIRHPHIANIRGRGLLVGFDLVEPGTETLLAKARCVEFFKHGLAEGVILMSYTPRVRIHPPLIITEDEARQALAMLDRGSCGWSGNEPMQELDVVQALGLLVTWPKGPHYNGLL